MQLLMRKYCWTTKYECCEVCDSCVFTDNKREKLTEKLMWPSLETKQWAKWRIHCPGQCPQQRNDHRSPSINSTVHNDFVNVVQISLKQFLFDCPLILILLNIYLMRVTGKAPLSPSFPVSLFTPAPLAYFLRFRSRIEHL